MTRLLFGSSSKIWDDISWVFGIEEIGFDGWEICADGNYHFKDDAHIAAIREVLASTGLCASIHAPYSDLNLLTINDSIWRESIRQTCMCIEKGHEFVETVTFHPGYLSPTSELVPNRAWDMLKSAVELIGAAADEYGVTACLENMPNIPGFLCQRPEEVIGLTEGVDGMSYTIDLGHAHTAGLLPEFIPLFSGASHMHMHGNNGMHDDHLPVGEGNLPWVLVSSALPSYAHSRDVCIVVEGRNLKEAEQSYKVLRRWIV
ncbi:MAG: sugar phosphate isomerase/epimerase [Methanomicrobiales archaeon]|jgi:sugar phosphate isomerase/epimerase|nr:sugar phosphate isomerase/epimerase [Methanomicrobiales archaeon]